MAIKATKRVMAAMVCGLVISAAPAMFAQENQSAPATQQGDAMPGGPGGPHHEHGQREEHRIEHMTKALNLTPDQVTQVKAIDATSHEQMRALHEDTATAPADKRAKMMAIHEDSMGKVRALLTDEQKSKFDAMQARMKEHREEQHGEHEQPAAPPAQ